MSDGFVVPALTMSEGLCLGDLVVRVAVYYDPDFFTVASVYAFVNLEPVGYLVWAAGPNESGDITRVWTLPELRRRRIASTMKLAAAAAAEERGWTPPAHSASRTLDGEAWATSFGAAPASEILPEWGSYPEG